MSNHSGISVQDNTGSKNTIFVKKDKIVKKKESKNQNKDDDMTDNYISTKNNYVSTKNNYVSTKNNYVSAKTQNDELINEQNSQPKSGKHTKSTEKYDIDSLSDSCEDQDDEENNESCMVLSLQDIIKSIPSSATKSPSQHMQQTHTEWRWRFFDLRGRKLIEISMMHPNSKRVYMNNLGNWTEYTLKKEWDEFLVDTKYCYVEK
jgi:hypothetical protein